MKISRSGYYKWLKNRDVLNIYEINRLDLKKLVEEIHIKKPSYGYRRINALIRRETDWVVSDNLVHKVCKALNIKSKARHYKYKKAGEESIKYPNIIQGNWNVSRPFEKIVSDTTTFWFKRKPYDWTFYLDIFNNEIVGSDVRESKHGWLKKEMYIDFDINNYNTVQEFIKDIVRDNNEYRPSYALKYKTPIEYKIQLGFR